jgi:DNA polymerase-3 subunit delta'
VAGGRFGAGVASSPEPGCMNRLSSILGQERAIGMIRRAVRADRLHHANLFHGPSGVGKRMTARALAAWMNCTGRSADADDACGECRSCRLMGSENHPDIVEVKPDGQFIKIDQVRAMQQLTRFRPHEAQRRVILIEQADALREEAANAMLKTLEEPTGDTVFFLVTAQPHLLLSTIRSRCQPVQFSALAPGYVSQILVSNGVEPAAAQRVSRLCEGSVSRATEVLESPVYASRDEVFENLWRLMSGQIDRAIRWAEELARARAELPAWLSLLRTIFRDVALHAGGASSQRQLHWDALEAVVRLSERSGLRHALYVLQRIEESERLLLGNVNPRMVMECLLLDIARVPTPVAR